MTACPARATTDPPYLPVAPLVRGKQHPEAGGVMRAKALTDSGHDVLESEWGDAHPDAEAENAYLASHPAGARPDPLDESKRIGKVRARGNT